MNNFYRIKYDLNNARIDITTDIWLDAITDDETVFPSHHSPSYM